MMSLIRRESPFSGISEFSKLELPKITINIYTELAKAQSRFPPEYNSDVILGLQTLLIEFAANVFEDLHLELKKQLLADHQFAILTAKPDLACQTIAKIALENSSQKTSLVAFRKILASAFENVDGAFIDGDSEKWRKLAYLRCMCLAVLELQDPRFYRIIAGFHSYMSDLYDDMKECFNFAVTPYDVKKMPERRSPLIALTASGPSSSVRLMLGGRHIQLIFLNLQENADFLSWSVLANEGVGSDFLYSAPEVDAEFRELISELEIPEVWKHYMLQNLGALMSDVLAILNEGPAIGWATMKYLQNKRGGELNSIEIKEDAHVIDVFRICVMEACFLKLEMNLLTQLAWMTEFACSVYKKEVKFLDGTVCDLHQTRKVATQFVEIVVTKLLKSTGGLSLKNIFSWNSGDEECKNKILSAYGKGTDNLYRNSIGYYAAHTVAAAVEHLFGDNDFEDVIMDQTMSALESMALKNKRWTLRAPSTPSLLKAPQVVEQPNLGLYDSLFSALGSFKSKPLPKQITE